MSSSGSGSGESGYSSSEEELKEIEIETQKRQKMEEISKRMIVTINNEELDKLTENERPIRTLMNLGSESMVLYESREKVPERFLSQAAKNTIFRVK
jgi:hypothetical protein